MERGLCPCTFHCRGQRLSRYPNSRAGMGVWLNTLRAHRGAKATRLLSPSPCHHSQQPRVPQVLPVGCATPTSSLKTHI